MINVLHIRASNFYGGPERQIHYHCLKSKNTEFNIIASSYSENNVKPEFLDLLHKDNIRTHTFIVKNAYDKKTVELIRNFLKNNDINILCTHEYRSHFYGGLASKNLNIRWIAFSRGWTRDNLKIKLYTWFDKFVIRFADRIVAVSESQKNKLEAVFVASKKINVVHNAIDPSSFENIPKINLREKYNLKDDSIICVAGGRFSAEKGQKYLIKAAKIAYQQNKNLVFIIFGDGPDFDEIKNKILKESLSEFIICPGFEKKLLGCIKGADVLINPSLSEGLPNIILEAMAFKVPCVATDVGGVAELIENTHNGLLVPAKSAGELAAAILKIVNNRKLAERYAENAYKTVITKFSFDTQFKRLRNIYNYLMDQ